MINQIHIGHCLEVLKRIPDNSVHCCITSPPYFGLRDYQLDPAKWPEVSFSPMPGLPPLYVPAQECCLGLEKDIWSYVGHMVLVFREVWRVLRDDGTLWLNLGDSYTVSGGKGLMYGSTFNNNGLSQVRPPKTNDLKPKDLMGIPFRVAYALQADRWYLRSDVIWHKPNPMPESVTDRPTKAHEYVFLMSKSERYFYDGEAIKEQATEGTDLGLLRGKNAGGPGADKIAWHAESILKRQKEGVDSRTANPSGTRNRRTVWTVATQPYAAAHFATFPPKLIEPMILASTSEYGVCGECGGPWVRVTEDARHITEDGKCSGCGESALKHTVGQKNLKDKMQGINPPFFEYKGHLIKLCSSKNTTGWRPSCQCDAPTVPAVVLDPFMGSGTTAKVCIANRRNYIGIDANPTYAEELAPERLNGTQIKLV